MDAEYTEALRTGYDRVARRYGEAHFGELAHKPLDRALLAAFAEILPGGGRVADIGCGPGQVARYLHDLRLHAFGVDLSPGMVELARELSPGIEFLEASMLDLPLPNDSLAGITAFYCIIHLPPADRPRALAEFFRVLQSGGALLLAFHVGDETIHADEFFEQQVSIDFRFLRPDEVRGELLEAGFTIGAYLERPPYLGFEHPSTRGYFLATKP